MPSTRTILRRRAKSLHRNLRGARMVARALLNTGHPLLARRGPQLLPAVFSHDQDGCIRSLAALALLDTEVLVPGHGDLWRGPIRAATDEATALAQ